MAPGVRSIGDRDWIQNERRQCSELTNEYIEEFSFLAQNDLRWLNAHMDELLNSDKLSVETARVQHTILTRYRNLAEILKTPGKLRGKTPRTARKVDPQRAVCLAGQIFCSC